MPKGTRILVSSDPRPRIEECVVSGTPKPGTIMEIVAATAQVGTRFTYQAAARGSGVKGGNPVLLEDDYQGFLGVAASTSSFTGSGGQGGGSYYAPGTAYVSGSRGFLAWPNAGDQFNLIVTNQSGTADDIAIGQLLGVETTTGHLIKDSSYGSCPWVALEAVVDPTADFMLWVQYLGGSA